ncbi:MAG: hypothetical protein JNK78_17960 [Planctomycetes bacterium]|nr:hypothetical protein [Planctomycetota bacterium]
MNPPRRTKGSTPQLVVSETAASRAAVRAKVGAWALADPRREVALPMSSDLVVEELDARGPLTAEADEQRRPLLK